MHNGRISAYGILDINRDTEVLHSFLLTNVEEPDKESVEGDQKSPLKSQLTKKPEARLVPKGSGRKKEKKHVEFNFGKPQSKRRDSQLSERKVIVSDEKCEGAKLDEKLPDDSDKDKDDKDKYVDSDKPDAEQKKKKVNAKLMKEELTKTRRRRRRPKPEELYTDKDRAAAVNMGTKDIKQSLKIKRRQDRTRNLQISEEAEPTTFLALGNFEMSKGEEQIALQFLNKALELNPTDKNCLVARSKCYLLLGQPDNGLKDAEAALAIDKNFMKGIYQKAESLYYLGDFEHSLMYHYRGLRIRPDYEGFQLGIRKTQKAIENAIGGAMLGKKKSSTLSISTKSSEKSKAKGTATTISSKRSSIKNTPEPKIVKDTPKSTQRSTPMPRPITADRSSKLLRELRTDKEYLDSLLGRPDLKCKINENDSTVIGYIKDAVDFLNTRQEFWRQQLPCKFK